MVLRRVARRLAGKPERIISLDAWNAIRQECVTRDFHKEYGGGKEALEGLSWLSLVCYIEEIDPVTLALPAALLQVVNDDLHKLRAIGPLEAYAWCLEKLHAADEQSRGEIEAQHVDDQE